MVHKYLLKLRQEREARLAGRIVAADFYVRQLTWIEVALDLMGSGGGLELLAEFRKGDRHLVQIAETPFSKILDEARREKWAELGEPDRPEHPPRDRLIECDGYSVEAEEVGEGDGYEAQQASLQAQYRKQAEALIVWETEARDAAAAWRTRLGLDVDDARSSPEIVIPDPIARGAVPPTAPCPGDIATLQWDPPSSGPPNIVEEAQPEGDPQSSPRFLGEGDHAQHGGGAFSPPTPPDSPDAP